MHTQTEKHTHAIDALGEVERHSHTHTHIHKWSSLGEEGGEGSDRGKARRSPRQTTPTYLGPDKTSSYPRLPSSAVATPSHAPLPPSSTHRHRRRRDSRAVVVGCIAGCMWPRSMQSASVSAVPMQRRAGKPPIIASTCILLVARSQWRLLTRWVSVPRAPLFPLPFPSLLEGVASSRPKQ